MSGYYTTLCYSVKWYKNVLLEIILGTCIVNIWVLYNNLNRNKKLDMLQIRQTVIKELLQCEEESAEAKEWKENVEAKLDPEDNACAQSSRN